MRLTLFLMTGWMLVASPLLFAQDQHMDVSVLSSPPKVDGVADEWAAEWQKIRIKPAMENDDKNFTGELDVDVQVGRSGTDFYMVVRWPDKEKNTEYRPWKWRGKKYKRGRERDDMFAVRFEKGGDFHSCMIADADYEVDVWLWSAGRSNQARYATDGFHTISTKITENAAEYETDSGKTVYIKKFDDAGKPGFKNTRRSKKQTEKELPGVEFLGQAEGSIADVTAEGVWKEGVWTVEFRRAMNTGNSDDAVLPDKGSIRGQIAVFNHANAEHKSFSQFIEFRF